MGEKKQHLWIDRRNPRISIELDCRVAVSGGTAWPARIINLSTGGMKFGCPRETFLALLPESQRTPGLIQDVTIEVNFALQLPAEDINMEISTRAGIIHTERLAQDSYHIGIQFLDLRNMDLVVLDRYIALVADS